MTQDIIAMAREAGFTTAQDVWPQEFERFAALVAAPLQERIADLYQQLNEAERELDSQYKLGMEAERNKLAAWMMAQGYATGHGDTIEQLLDELRWQVRESERQACAALCDQLSDSSRDLRFGAAVRARSQA
jgi:hypothetical protein